MTDQTYVLPVKRMGNDKKPKLVILLSNPGGGTRWPARLPEYVMKADGVYSDCGMDIETLRKYNEWWDDFFNVFQKHNIAPSDVLFLEYYPYHTVSSSDFDLNPKFWPDYAKAALDENVAILHRCLMLNIPVFGYYYGGWMRAMPALNDYEHIYKSKTRWKKQKIGELDAFLSLRQ